MTPDKSRYLCFTKSVTEADSVAKYERRYGAKPEKVFTMYGMTWVGPVPETEEQGDAKSD